MCLKRYPGRKEPHCFHRADVVQWCLNPCFTALCSPARVLVSEYLAMPILGHLYSTLAALYFKNLCFQDCGNGQGGCEARLRDCTLAAHSRCTHESAVVHFFIWVGQICKHIKEQLDCGCFSSHPAPASPHPTPTPNNPLITRRVVL